MSHYLDPDKDHAFNGPSFRLPQELEETSEIMHAAGVIIHRFGILLRGPSGSGKSLLQRKLRQEAQARGKFSALISDDYVRLARPDPQAEGEGAPLLAFAPVTTRQLQEVRGIGVIELEPSEVVSRAVIHLLVDLVAEHKIERMPGVAGAETLCLGAPVAHLSVPERSVDVASDLVFALLSTWKR
ncbi:hypothetical protein [uncultured Cohaesibacter sp.]|uniref:HPr kinase/phosphorylase n=1 Tax=uncultured Cohaesibacter sp. TaxID=1002546 RepID=UPI0029C91482|nr:hypothetical protein [uncultured Cohaesibacter sp.]